MEANGKSDLTIIYRLQKQLLSAQGILLAAIVLGLIVVAWLRQGACRALVGGLILYIFLSGLMVLSSYLQEKRSG